MANKTKEPKLTLDQLQLITGGLSRNFSFLKERLEDYDERLDNQDRFIAVSIALNIVLLIFLMITTAIVL